MAWLRNRLVMPPELAAALGGEDPFDAAMRLQGKVYRDLPGRKTMQVEIAGKSYFIKQHFGVGWREIFKNLMVFRFPIISAMTEWRAIGRLAQLGIATTPAVAFGCRGVSPAGLQSFLITGDLGDIVSLEDFCRDWPDHPPPISLKRQLIREVARIARVLHDNGMNHRDFYLCHFCLDRKKLQHGEIRLSLIDLHRAGMRRKVPLSARMKDMAGLYFSALDIGLSGRDCLRFLRLYRGRPLPEIARHERKFWRAVCERADRLYFKFHRRHTAVPGLS